MGNPNFTGKLTTKKLGRKWATARNGSGGVAVKRVRRGVGRKDHLFREYPPRPTKVAY